MGPRDYRALQTLNPKLAGLVWNRAVLSKACTREAATPFGIMEEFPRL